MGPEIMKADSKAKRRAEIEAVALEVMRSRGYEGASMLTIAKAAKASNETLYRWYGDKPRLFLEIVKGNASDIEVALDKTLSSPLPAADTLHNTARLLLNLLLGERSVALNRAAASDASGDLGAAIAKGGRDRVFPRIIELMERLRLTGVISAPSDEQAAEWFLHLLIGDLQMRRVIGTLPPLTRKQLKSRVETSLSAFFQLCAPNSPSAVACEDAPLESATSGV